MKKTSNRKPPCELKSYHTLQGSIVMYQRANMFGVVLKHPNGVVFAPNFHDEGSSCRTFQGNEMGVIDWVDQAEATRRYNHLLLVEINRTSQLISDSNEKSCRRGLLRVVR